MAMAGKRGINVKHGKQPDEQRPFAAHGHADIHKMGNGVVMQGTFEPGWKWSKDVKPIAGTKSCEATHLGYVISGRMVIKMDDGNEAEIGPGDFFEAGPGHDAWVVGNEPCILVDFAGYEAYAKRVAAQQQPGERASAPSMP
jgi:quercetin dioxygenase-like cupin family protein